MDEATPDVPKISETDTPAFEPITTAEQFQERAEKALKSRLDRQAAKHAAELEELKAVHAAELKSHTEASAALAARTEAAEKIVAEAAVSKMRDEVAAEFGVPVHLLVDGEREQVAAHAAKLAEALAPARPAPVASEGLEKEAPVIAMTGRQWAEQLR